MSKDRVNINFELLLMKNIVWDYALQNRVVVLSLTNKMENVNISNENKICCFVVYNIIDNA